jgi:hypothetical protein
VTLANNTTQAYGTIGLNDSGGQMNEFTGYTKWTFQMIPLTSTVPSGFQVAILGTVSPWAYLTWEAALAGYAPAAWIASNNQPAPQLQGLGNGRTLPVPIARQGYSNASGFIPGCNPWEWVLLPGPSDSSGTGVIANPMTTNSPLFNCSLPLESVRAIVVAQGTAGTVRIVAEAVP